MIITNDAPKRRGFFLSVPLRGAVLSGFESNTPMDKEHVEDEITSCAATKYSRQLYLASLVPRHHPPPSLHAAISTTFRQQSYRNGD